MPADCKKWIDDLENKKIEVPNYKEILDFIWERQKKRPGESVEYGQIAFGLESKGIDYPKDEINGNTYPVSYTVNSVDGNVVSFGNSGTSTSLEYYTDKSIQPGDYLEFPTWIYYGVSIYPRKNLIKKVNSGGGNFEEVSYEFDADGKITKAIVNYGSGVNTYTYQYQCD